jgi:glutaredoxin
MVKIKLYTKPTCPFCNHAKELFQSLEQKYEDINIYENSQEYEKVAKELDYHTVPLILIDNKFIGGDSELIKLLDSGKLVELLKG